MDPHRLPTQYLFSSWQDELPQNTVRALAQTPDGFLWIGTQDGLVRFDGVRFTLFDQGSVAALANDDIRVLRTDSSGRLWIGTRGGGLLFLAGESFQATADDAAPGHIVYALAEGADGAMWIGTRDRGLLRWHDGALEEAPLGGAPGLPESAVVALLEDRHGTLWAGLRDAGLVRFRGGRFEAVGADLLAGDSVLCLLEDGDGGLWAGTRSRGLFHLTAEESGTVRIRQELAEVPVWSLLEDRDGNLWAGTYGGGLHRRDPDGRWSVLSDGGGLTSNQIVSLFEDREGSLWVGTEGGGLNQLREGPFLTYGEPEGLLGEQVWTVLEAGDGAIWLGTDGGGLSRIEDGRVTNLTPADGLSGSSITTLYEDHTGALWAGIRGQGLDRLTAAQSTAGGSDTGWRVERFGPAAGLGGETVSTMLEDRRGRLWVGTLGRGLLRRDGERFMPVAGHPGLADDRVWVLAEGAAGELLIGTDGEGLKILTDDGLSVVDTTAGLSNDVVVSLHVDADGAVWIGTYGGGLNRLADGRVDVFTTVSGLYDDVILQILDDHHGQLWMSCNKGVFRVAKAELAEVAAGRRQQVTSVAYGKADGMRAAECNGALQPAGVRGDDGRLWFPTIAGVVSIDPTRLDANPIPPGVVIEAVLADGERLAALPPPRLAAGVDRFEVRFTATTFVAPERVRFRYRLEGYDRAWVEAGNSRQATYTNLPTGRDYRFQVIAANGDGVWNEAGASFAFAVEPHLWQRPAFLVLAAAVLALLTWTGYQLRVRQLLRRTQQLEELVARRTAEVVAQKDQLEDANQALRRLNQFKSEFLGIAAHDLKNPLTVIYGYAGLLAARAGDDDRQARVARRVSASASQMLNIVSDLLDTTALESGKLTFEPVVTALAPLLAETLERHRVTAADRQIDLHLDAQEGLTAPVDREKLVRVVDNLVSNAIRYSKEGTRVDILLQKAGNPPGSSVRLAVRDQGPGLSREQTERIFERFERLAAKHGVGAPSTGLGLSIVKRFVELHGGRVWVESHPGQGSTFLVELPATEAERNGRREPSADPAVSVEG